MRLIKSLLATALSATFALGLTGCGQGNLAAPGLHRSARVAGVPANLDGRRGPSMAARAAGWEDAVVMDDFTSGDYLEYRYRLSGISQSDLFNRPITYSRQHADQAKSTVLEVVAPAGPTPHKGFGVNTLETPESFLMGDAPAEGEADKRKLAKRVMASFKWATNMTPSSQTALSSMVIYMFKSKQLGTAALAYAWSNTLQPGTVISTKLPIADSEDKPDMRILVLEKSNGLNVPVGFQALNQMMPKEVNRNFVKDVRYAFRTRGLQLAVDSAEIQMSAAPATVAPPSTDFGGKDDPVNDDILGIEGIAVGADVPGGVCAQALIDDIAYQLKATE